MNDIITINENVYIKRNRQTILTSEDILNEQNFTLKITKLVNQYVLHRKEKLFNDRFLKGVETGKKNIISKIKLELDWKYKNINSIEKDDLLKIIEGV